MLCPSGGQVNATASVGGAAVDCAREVIAGAGGADAVLDPQPARSSTRARSTRSTIRRSSKAKRRRQSRKMRRSSRRIRAFVLYSFRHTFLTRVGESGCDAWRLARIAAHNSIAISSRYVHPSEDVVLDAMARLGGHNFGHNAETRELADKTGERKWNKTEEENWRARRDSNSRPIAPEAVQRRAANQGTSSYSGSSAA